MIDSSASPNAAAAPLSAADRALLAAAAQLHRPIARAAKLGLGNGMGYAVFGGLSLLYALPSWDLIGIAIGAVLLGVGLHERAQSKCLLQADANAPSRLASGELVLLGAIVTYGVLGLTVLPAAGDRIAQQLGGAQALGIDIQQLANSVSIVWYATIIAVALLYQGGMARYFLKRRAEVARYRAQVPAWAREVLDAMAK